MTHISTQTACSPLIRAEIRCRLSSLALPWNQLCLSLSLTHAHAHERYRAVHYTQLRSCVEINVTSSPHPQQKKIQFSFTFIPETNVTVKDDTTTRDQATLFVCVPVCVYFSCSEIVNSFKVMYCCLYLQSHSRPQWCCSCSSMTSFWPPPPPLSPSFLPVPLLPSLHPYFLIFSDPSFVSLYLKTILR